ncbi:uncharacterized protein [Anabrus simplex]|uniref:uncharacterized protein n=1 Tax=Anabrus simplex TaxID=316456 RepID=UPI0035A2774C
MFSSRSRTPAAREPVQEHNHHDVYYHHHDVYHHHHWDTTTSLVHLGEYHIAAEYLWLTLKEKDEGGNLPPEKRETGEWQWRFTTKEEKETLTSRRRAITS